MEKAGELVERYKNNWMSLNKKSEGKNVWIENFEHCVRQRIFSNDQRRVHSTFQWETLNQPASKTFHKIQ